MIRQGSMAELSARWQATLARQRSPHSGVIELTWACSFGCRHCYLPSHAASHSLDASLVERLLPELAQAGCLSLCWTGGEPLLHPRFFELHAQAVRLGFWVTLFTNGSLLDAAAVAQLKRLPPRSVEITLYGGDAASYAAVTGQAANFERVQRGVDALLAAGHKLLLKAMLTRDLAPHLDAVRAFARARGQELRLDPVIDRCLDGGRQVLQQRLAFDAQVHEVAQHGVQRERLGDYDRRVRAQRLRGEPVACGAARSAFFVDAQGRLTPCVLLREPAIPLRDRPFARAWQELAAAAPVHHAPDSACGACEVQHLCNHCPGVQSSMRDAPEAERAFYCQVARSRAELVPDLAPTPQVET